MPNSFNKRNQIHYKYQQKTIFRAGQSGMDAKKILPRCREAKRKDCVILESLTD